jgi:hypothetical protein
MTDTNYKFPKGHPGEKKQKRLDEAAKRKRKQDEHHSMERLQELLGKPIPGLLRALAESIEQLTESLNRDGAGRAAPDK